MPKTFESGYMVFVQSDHPSGNEWWKAKTWQKEEFIKAMEFGTQKSMCYPNPVTESKPFRCSENGFNYKFIILNDWGPVFLENIDTGKQREVKYLNLEPHDENQAFQTSKGKVKVNYSK